MPILPNFLERFFSDRRARRDGYQILDNPANPPNALLDAGELAFANNGNQQSLYSALAGNQLVDMSSNAVGYYASPWAGLGTRAVGTGILSAIQTGNPFVGLLVGGVSALSSLPSTISQQSQWTKEKQQRLRDERQEKILQILERYEKSSKTPDGTPQMVSQSLTQNFITPAPTPTSSYFRNYSTFSSHMKPIDLSGFSLLINPRNSARIRSQNLYNA